MEGGYERHYGRIRRDFVFSHDWRCDFACDGYFEKYVLKEENKKYEKERIDQKLDQRLVAVYITSFAGEHWICTLWVLHHRKSSGAAGISGLESAYGADGL